MMKKLLVFLLMTLYCVLSIFCGLNLASKETHKISNDFFNATVMVEQKSNHKRMIQCLKEIADMYEISMAKVFPSDSGEDIYVYSPDAKFEKEVLHLKPLHSGEFYTNKKNIKDAAGYFSLFNNNEVKVHSLEDVDKVRLNGMYSVNAQNPEILPKQIESVNAKYSESLHIYENRKLKKEYSRRKRGNSGYLY